jgi:ribosomal protein S18 acetylase RimI-like enzyme
LSTNAEQDVKGLHIVRVGVDKAPHAADLLRRVGAGVMDMIAHFWDRLPQTPPLSREDLHLVGAWPAALAKQGTELDFHKALGAMLYVPKAHRADVFAPDPVVSDAFTSYLTGWERLIRFEPPPPVQPGAPAEIVQNGNMPINYIAGEATGIEIMLPGLLALVNRKTPAKKLVNVMMQLPLDQPAVSSEHVRAAKDGDEQVLNRWRKMYAQERGILFDADVDDWIKSGNVFVYELNGQVVSVAKFDLNLQNIVEIGGVYTFQEFRKRGIAKELVHDLVARIRQMNKKPVLQVDVTNEPAFNLYREAGWVQLGRLARVWLINS